MLPMIKHTNFYPTKIISAVLLFIISSGALANKCSPETSTSINLTADINGWGINNKNHRFISETDAGITPENLSKLQVKWVFALPDTKTPHSQPFITPDTVFIGDEPGVVYALDRETGCEKWRGVCLGPGSKGKVIVATKTRHRWKVRRHTFQYGRR
jgi:glucose dehydrogenase